MGRARPVEAMVRLFKHYVPHAVQPLGTIDFMLLLIAGKLSWRICAWQSGMDPGSMLRQALHVILRPEGAR